MKTLLAIAALLLPLSLFGATGKKISDYTETLTLDDSWIFEVAVPGVTNYKATIGTIASNIVARGGGGGGGIGSTNGNQFGPSVTLTIGSGALLTNLSARGLTVPNVTALRPAFISGSGDITNASGTPDGTKFMRDDGVLAVPNGAGTGGTNYPPIVTTGTNIVVGTGVRKSLLMPTNQNTIISFNGTEILGEQVTLFVTNTSASASNIVVTFFQDGAQSSYFDPTVATNVGGFFVASNSTKTLFFTYNGSNWRLDGSTAKEMELVVTTPLSLSTNTTGDTVTLAIAQQPSSNSITPVVVSGTGGANTNFTLMATNGEQIIGVTTNVSIVAIMGYSSSLVNYVNVLITNGSGTSYSFQMQQTTNSPRWMGVYGTNAPSVVTNNTQLLLSVRVIGTNALFGYSYAPWP